MTLSKSIPIIILLLLSTYSIAQESGIKTGIEAADFDKSGPAFYPSNNNEKVRDYTKLRIGIYKYFRINSSFGIQPEFYFVQKGSKIKGNHWYRPETEFTARYSISYLEFPVLMKYTAQLSSFSVYFIAGPYMAIRLGARLYEATELNGNKFDDNQKFRITNNVKPFDMGFTVGCGGHINSSMQSVVFIIEGRYTHGITDINDIQNSRIKIRNRTLSLMIGLGF